MNNTLHEAALQYAEMGLKVFPVQPGGKSPLTKNGFHDATTDETRINAWWDFAPDANIGCALDGLFVVDIDPGGEEWLAGDPDKQMDLLTGATQQTPRGGTHHVFKLPEGALWSRKVKQVHADVDLLTEGGYIVLPPSRVAGKGDYRWIEGCELESIDRLREPMEWLKQSMESLNGYANLNGKKKVLKKKLNASEQIQDGGRNDALARHAGYLRRANFSRGPLEAALRAIDQEQCNPPLSSDEDGEREFQKIIDSAIRNMSPDMTTEAIVNNNLVSIPLTQGDIEEETTDPGDFPEELLECGGLMQRICQHIDHVSRRPQPVLSVGAALALMSGITGRKVKDETGTRGNVYCVAVADAGNGKNNGLAVVKNIISDAGGRSILHPSAFHSESSIWKLLDTSPTKLALIDEIGHYITAFSSKKAGSHLQAVPSAIMQLFSQSDSFASPKASADDSRNYIIDQPHLAIFGASTPGSFFEAITQESVESGFLPRVLFFVAPDAHVESRLTVPDDSVPSHILESVSMWLKFQPGGNLADIATPQPFRVAYTPMASGLFGSIHQQVNKLEQESKIEFRPLWRRCIEMLRKVTLLHACSLSRSPTETIVEIESVQWGWSLIQYLYKKQEYLIAEHMASSEFEALQKQLVHWLRKRPGRRATHRETMRGILQRLPARLRDDVVQTVLESGTVWRFEEEITRKNGRKYTVKGYSVNVKDREVFD